MENHYFKDFVDIVEKNMEFKECDRCRWPMFIGGLFWTILVPIAYVISFSQVMAQDTVTKVFVPIAMLLLWLAAIKIFSTGITGLVVNGKKHLILKGEELEIIINSGKLKGTIHKIRYQDIKDFYFVSHGIKKDKISRKYFVKENASGSINFYVKDIFYETTIYNALPAAKKILSHLEFFQIDNTKNELDRQGNYTPKDGEE